MRLQWEQVIRGVFVLTIAASFVASAINAVVWSVLMGSLQSGEIPPSGLFPLYTVSVGVGELSTLLSATAIALALHRPVRTGPPSLQTSRIGFVCIGIGAAGVGVFLAPLFGVWASGVDPLLAAARSFTFFAWDFVLLGLGILTFGSRRRAEAGAGEPV